MSGTAGAGTSKDSVVLAQPSPVGNWVPHFGQVCFAICASTWACRGHSCTFMPSVLSERTPDAPSQYPVAGRLTWLMPPNKTKLTGPPATDARQIEGSYRRIRLNGVVRRHLN